MAWHGVAWRGIPTVVIVGSSLGPGGSDFPNFRWGVLLGSPSDASVSLRMFMLFDMFFVHL